MNIDQIEQTNPIMFSKQEVYRYRLTPFIEKRIADSGTDGNNSYLQKYSKEKWIKYIIQEMEQLPLNQFLVISDEDLNKRVGGLMSLELVAGILTALTTEQLKAFDECLRRVNAIKLRADTLVCPYKLHVFLGCRGEPRCSPHLNLMALLRRVR